MNGETYQSLNSKLDASDRFALAVSKAQVADVDLGLVQEYANLDKTITDAMNRVPTKNDTVKYNTTLNRATALARRMFQDQVIPKLKNDLTRYMDFIRQEEPKAVRRFEKLCGNYS